LAENNVTLAGGAMIKPVLEFDECDLPGMNLTIVVLTFLARKINFFFRHNPK
jgi:hypothetical protein